MQVIGNNYWSAQIQKKEEGWQDYIVGMLSTNPQIQKKSTNPNEGRVAGLYSWNVEHTERVWCICWPQDLQRTLARQQNFIPFFKISTKRKIWKWKLAFFCKFFKDFFCYLKVGELLSDWFCFHQSMLWSN